MISSLQPTEDGKIYFSFDSSYHNVEVTLSGDDYENPIYLTNFVETAIGITYFIGISSTIIKYVKEFRITFTTKDKRQEIKVNFPKGDLKNYSIVCNSCLGWLTYETFNIQYNSPFIGHLILDDMKYLNMCENYDYYMAQPPILGKVQNNEEFRKMHGTLTAHNRNDYPITNHADLDIHWIHNQSRKLEIPKPSVYEIVEGDYLPSNLFIKKWNDRVERNKGTEKIFVWSSAEFFNAHGDEERKEIVDRFKSLNTGKSIFLTELKHEEFEDDNHIVKFIPEFENFPQNNRLGRKLGCHWNDQTFNAQIVRDIIKSKFI